jgi:integrase
MARAVRNPKLDTRSARSKLPERREPHWTVISAGCALGYRRGAKGGTWLARMRGDDGKQHHDALGAADDARDPDGLTVFSFSQAQERAREFFTSKARQLAGHDAPSEGPYTVQKAIEDYLADRALRGSKGVRADRYAAEARILPTLGKVELSKLTTQRIKDWRHEIEKSPKLLRSKPGAAQSVAAIDTADAEAVRSRKATTNRILTVLKASLNHAFAEGKVSSDLPWRKVKPYREVDAPVIRYLSGAESVRLVNGCEGAFRDLVRGALVTGCRYGELVRMKVSDFNADAGKVTVALSKAGKRRHVTLAEEGQRLFSGLTAGRKPAALIFDRKDGEPWKASQQQRPIEEASKRAGIVPPATFHVLRHSYASSLAMKGVPLQVIAEQLGHADTRMTEKHYAHLAPSYVSDVVRAALPGLGIVPETNVAALSNGR